MKLPAKSLAIFFLASTGFAEALLPTRQVQQNVLISDHEPNVRIELPQQVHYVGSDRWVLNNVADCELHVFVEADDTKLVKRLYWIQFEGFLPSKPKLRHHYSTSQKTNLGPMEFLIRARFGSTEEPLKPGSDGEHVRKLLNAGGYREPAAMMNVRFVHLLDDSARQELMIIYSEDLGPSGVSVPELLPGGAAESRWAPLSEGLIQRAKEAILIESPSPPTRQSSS